MKKTLLFLFISLFAQSGFSQTAEKGGVRGFVYNAKTKEPIVMATVGLFGTKYGTTTDVNGFFNFTNVEAGSYRLIVRSVGFDSSAKEVVVANGKIANVTFNITERTKMLKNIDISAKKQLSKTKVNMSTVNISPKEISKLPSIGGESDLAQYLQVVPGVVSTGDQGGQVYIRGGTPVMTKFLLDGMTVYNPFHSIGFFSTYETEIVKNVDIYTGGFTARFGNRVSAVVDVTTRDGNKKNFQGRISMNPWASKVILEGPLGKKSVDDASSVSYILSGKYSYLDQSSKIFYPHIADNLPYSFADLYGKINFSAKSGNKISLFGFNFRDNANFLNLADFDWQNSGVGMNTTIVPQESNLMVNIRLNYSSYGINLKEADNKIKQSSIAGFEAGFDFATFIKGGEVRYGLELTGFETDYRFTNRFGKTSQAIEQYTSEAAVYTVVNLTYGKFVFEPSLRTQYYGSISEAVIEPRLGIKWNTTSKIRTKFSTGMYSQNLISTKSDRDIVNLFNGFIAGNEDAPIKGDGTKADSKLQKSLHFIFGVELDFAKNWTINIEPYYMYYPQIINVNRRKLYNSDPNFMVEEGETKGLDISVKYDSKRVNVWAGYSLSKTTRQDDTVVYPTHFDRRHNANLVTSFNLGKKFDWEISARFNFGSGFPFTKTQAFFEELQNPGAVTSPYTNSNGTVGVVYDKELNGGRLPYFHRLDVSAKKTFSLGEKAKVEVSLSIINVYDRNNVFYFDRLKYQRVDQLPIIPSMGISAIF